MQEYTTTLGEKTDEERAEMKAEIREYPLDRINRQLWNDGIEDVEELEEQFREFLCEYVENPDGHPTPPSERVDMYWHKFILDTRLYRRFCDDVFGEYLHHDVPASDGASG